MKTKCLILDDEPLARKLIKHHLKHFPDFEIVSECENAIEASTAILSNHIDLLFLDIQMPEINGIDFLKSLTKKPKVIITSAYKEFAIDGFELDVVDFLLKPITLDRFFRSINKYKELDNTTTKETSNVIPKKTDKQKDLLIKDNNKTYRIDPNDILFIEGMREYIKVITTNDNIITKVSLTKFFDQLPQDTFIRVHKSFIINKNNIKAFTSNHIEIKDKRIPIGRSYKINTLNMLNDK